MAGEVYSGARVVGRVTGGWLVKTGLDPARHKIHTPSGWATDAVHLQLPGLRGVRLVLQDGTTLEADLATWRRYGRPLSRGHGRQTLLLDQYWRVRRPGEPEARQLALFPGGAP